MPRVCSSIKHHVVYRGVSWHCLCALGEGQWQWELGRASLCKWCWSEMCVASAGQGHTDSDLGVGQSPHSAWQKNAAPYREFWAKKCPSQSLLWLRLHCRAELCPLLQNGLYFEKPQPEISSSHTAIPAWACFFPLAFHSLSSLSWSLTLKKSVCTRNCTHSSYPFHRSLAFIKTKCYCTVNSLFVVSFLPPMEVQWYTDSVFLS